MRDQRQDNAFSASFLSHLARNDRGGYTGQEVATTGPWTVLEREEGFAVVLEAEGEHGLADAVFDERETALLLASVLPLIGKNRHYCLTEASDHSLNGFWVQAIFGGRLQKIGWLRYDQPDQLEALHLVESLIRSPASLAFLLGAGSRDALCLAGRRLTNSPSMGI